MNYIYMLIHLSPGFKGVHEREQATERDAGGPGAGALGDPGEARESSGKVDNLCLHPERI